MTSTHTLLYALLGGVLPALIWLAFWLREDYKNPEPRRLILRTFLLGMGAVILVLPFQKMVDDWLPGMTLGAIILWAILEELFKFLAAYAGGLRTRDDNEPIDAIIYMVTAALGFVALENTLFIFGPLAGKDVVQSFITGNLRFIGASLLHVVSSGLIGASLAFSFYKSQLRRFTKTTQALLVAIIFHTCFNIVIIYFGKTGTLISFTGVWVGVVYLLWTFERAKRIAR